MDRWRTTSPGSSVHFPRGLIEEPDPALLCGDGFVVLEIEGRTIDSKSDLIGGIEMGLSCPWFAEADPHESSNWDGFLDVLTSSTEWLEVTGVVVALYDAKSLWTRLYRDCGTLVEIWLEATKVAQELDKPMHLVFVQWPLKTPASADRWERRRPFREVEAIRWMPRDAILPH